MNKIIFVLAWRNIMRNKRRTLITVSSVFFACILSVTMLSMAKGLKEQMIENMVRNSTGYVQIQDVAFEEEPSLDHSLELTDELQQTVDKHSELYEFTVPRLSGFALAAKEMQSKPALVTGIDPERENRMNNLKAKLSQGEFLTAESDFVLVASGLAQSLNVELGDTLVLLGQGFHGITATGKYRVGGILDFPMPEQNNQLIYMSVKSARYFFGAPNHLSSLIFMVEDEPGANKLAAALKADIGELNDGLLTVKTWEDLIPDAVGLLDFREAINEVMMWILYIVVGFGIFGTVVTMMYERIKEFGVMLAVGMKRFRLAAMVYLEVLIISFLGVLVGTGTSLPIMIFLNKNPIPLSENLEEYMQDFGMDPLLPFSLQPDVFWYQAVVILIISSIIGVYAVRKIFTLNIIKSAQN